MIPGRKQWNKWSLPSKATYIGTIVGVIGLFFVAFMYFTDSSTPPRPRITSNGIGRSGETIVIKPNEQQVILAYLLNTGNSPALEAELFGCSSLGPREIEENDSCPPLNHPSTAVIGAGGEQFVALTLGPYTAEQIQSIVDGSLKLSVLVGADYSDDAGHRYRSEFCSVYSPLTHKWFGCEKRSDKAN